MLKNIIKAEEFQPTPPMMLVYGSEGIGKTTFAAQMKNPIFIKTEEGFPVSVRCDSFPVVRSYNELIDDLKSIVSEEHDYKTVVIDHLDGVEQLVNNAILRDTKTESMSAAYGGYGKAYDVAQNRILVNLVPLLEEIKLKRIWICLLAHAKVKTVKDPIDGEYQQFSPSCVKDGWMESIRNLCDCIFFATGKFKNSGFGESNSRVFKCQPSKYFTAKNRFSDDEEIPMSFESVCNAFRAKANKS